MACSTARVEANRRNAQKSTGPRTAAGKAASRLNAFRHGMAGDGDVVGPGEDVALIERREVAFVREFAAEGETGRLLARRAAVLSLRMERAMDHDFTKVADDVAAARAQFDVEREAMLAGWIAELDEAADPRPALDNLEATVEGQVFLAEAWLVLRARVAVGDAGAVSRAELWLDRPGLAIGATLAARIGAESDRLLDLAESTGDEYRARIAAARDRAGILASFDPSPEAQRARRHEADAERGMYRAIRQLRELRREAGAGPIPLAPAFAPPPPVIPEPVPAPPASEIAPPLGSIRAEPAELASFRVEPPATPAEPTPSREERHRNRPDLRKLARNRR